MRRRVILGLGASMLAACRRGAPSPPRPAPLPQRAYVWQRDWSAPVAAAIARGKDNLAGFVVLGAEIEWIDRTARAVKPNLDWRALRECRRPVGLAVRVVRSMAAMAQDDGSAPFICETAQALVNTARAAGVTPREIQLDFDCAQKQLTPYANWVRAVRDAIQPVPLVITTLPSWLGEHDFLPLVRETGRYVLQVHSLPSLESQTVPALCDPVLARKWVARSAALGVPFEIALPTYRYRAGYDAAGKFIGIESDSVQPAWPATTRVLEFSADAHALAELVREWTVTPPAHCEGLIWYRLPVATDRNNWPWATLLAVMQGREPRTSFQARINGRPPGPGPVQLADLSVFNDGEIDEAPAVTVVATWSTGARAIADALPGWTVRVEAGQALFLPGNPISPRLPPGASRAMGWLRLEPAATIHVEIRR